MATAISRKGELIQDPPLISKLFNDTRAAWLWLPVRIWVGYQWLSAGIEKIGNPAWMQTGAALKGFLVAAAAVPANGRAPIAFAWYRTFIQMLINTQAYTWFAKVVTVGEVLVGVALILGVFTGISGFFGAFMNWNYIMAGTASTNALLLVLGLLLLAAWKVSGYLGADYFIIRFIGTPWWTTGTATAKEPARIPSKAQPAPAHGN
ncbi:MAG: DoxX family protein [Anaerolineales bacterium]|jgi:thiosulfate dehydrogenase [quinone] large subunit